MIKTMSQFHDVMALARASEDPVLVLDLVEVLELRIRRIEHHIGIEIPEDLIRVRAIENRRRKF